jgi:hypothetical protein
MLYFLAYSIGMFAGVGLVVVLRRLKDNFGDDCTPGFTLRIVRPALNDAQVIGIDSLAIAELVENHGKDGVWRFPIQRDAVSTDGNEWRDLDCVISLYTLQGM